MLQVNRILFVLTCIATVIAALSCTMTSAPSWLDTDGRPRSPLTPGGRAATILLFIAPDCPISNSYAPEIVRIAEAYEPKDVAVFAVHSDPGVSAAAAKQHASDYGYTFPVLLDPQQTLAHHVGATVTPEAVVLDANGEVRYVGRIDDLYYGFGKRREAPTRRDLRDAIDAVIAGKPAPAAGGPPIGCEIPPPPIR
jgi:thiol-disulfide isomerase/thioredoxin